ncbi:unnamed protein product [Urochloa humidicola]
MLGRRSCGSSGHSAAVSFGGRRLELHQVFRPVPPLSSLRPAGRNLESLRRFSSVGREQTGKSEGVGRMWWQRCRNRVNNLDVFDRFNLKIAYASVLFVGCTIYGLMSK